MKAQPFRIRVEPVVLDDLQMRLQRTRWSSVIRKMKSEEWEFGVSPEYLRELVLYWRTEFDWRQQEGRLNALAHFKAKIDTANLHFIQVRGRRSQSTPLLLLHGWPDSFYRFHKVIPLLTNPAPTRLAHAASHTFDVVVPSLPGFAFTGPVRRATNEQPNRHTAHLLYRLMTEVLGYSQFAVAGGDGGSAIAQILAIDHPEAVTGIHLTDLGWHATSIDPSTASREEQKYLAAAKKQFMKDGAYALLQSTRPRSLAAGLNDSPVGLTSWIVDRFHAWADGYIEDRFSADDLLTNIMLYWVTQTIGPSLFNYYAETRSPSLTTNDHVAVPVGLALFPKDIGGIPPRSLALRTLNVERWTEMPQGGHFAALEEPKLYAQDLIEFFRPRTAAIDTTSDTEDFARALTRTGEGEFMRPLNRETPRVN